MIVYGMYVFCKSPAIYKNIFVLSYLPLSEVLLMTKGKQRPPARCTSKWSSQQYQTSEQCGHSRNG